MNYYVLALDSKQEVSDARGLRKCGELKEFVFIIFFYEKELWQDMLVQLRDPSAP